MSEQPAPKRHARAPVAVASLSPPKPVASRAHRAAADGAAEAGRSRMAAAKPQTGRADRDAPRRCSSNAAIEQPAMSGAPALIAAARRLRWPRADPVSTGSAGSDALAYAAAASPRRAARARPMGSRLPRMPAEATRDPGLVQHHDVVEAAVDDCAMRRRQRSDSPWLRAAMLTPSVSGFMTATRSAQLDPRWQQSCCISRRSRW